MWYMQYENGKNKEFLATCRSCGGVKIIYLSRKYRHLYNNLEDCIIETESFIKQALMRDEDLIKITVNKLEIGK